MPDGEDIQQALLDFDATIKAKPNLTDEELLQKFPELGNDIAKLQAAKDYSATLSSGKYKGVEEFNSKFPEFFPVEKKSEVGVVDGSKSQSSGSVTDLYKQGTTETAVTELAVKEEPKEPVRQNKEQLLYERKYAELPELVEEKKYEIAEKTNWKPTLTEQENLQLNEARKELAEKEKNLAAYQSPVNAQDRIDPVKLQRETDVANAKIALEKMETVAKFRDTENYIPYYDTETFEPIAVPKAELGQFLQDFMDEEFGNRRDIVDRGITSSEFKGKKFSELDESAQKVVLNAFSAKYLPKEDLQQYLSSQNMSFDLAKAPHAGNQFVKGVLNTTAAILDGAEGNIGEADVLNANYVKAKNGMITKSEYERKYSELAIDITSKIKNGQYVTTNKLPGIQPLETKMQGGFGNPEATPTYIYSEDQIQKWLSKSPTYEEIMEGRESPYVYENGLLGDWAEGIKGVAAKRMSNPAYEKNMLLTDIPQGLGSSVPFIASTVLSRGANIPANILTAVTGGFANASGVYEDAINSGATASEAKNAYYLAFGIGTTEAIPLDRLMDRFAAGTGMGRKAIEILLQGGEEAIQEGSTSLNNDLLAKFVYDESQKIGETLKSDASVGFATGVIMAAGKLVSTSKSATPEQKELVDKGVEQLQNYLKQRGETVTEAAKERIEKPVIETKVEPEVVVEEEKIVEPQAEEVVTEEIKPEEIAPVEEVVPNEPVLEGKIVETPVVVEEKDRTEVDTKQSELDAKIEEKKKQLAEAKAKLSVKEEVKVEGKVVEEPKVEQEPAKDNLLEGKTFVTHNKEEVSGEKLSAALNKVADDKVESAKKERNEPYADHITEKEKDEILAKDLKYAEEIRRGEHLNNLSIAQRINYELTGESIPILPKVETPVETVAVEESKPIEATPEQNPISERLSKYGWTVEPQGKDQVVRNANGKIVATVKTKGAKYEIIGNDGGKLMSGNKNVADAVENVATKYFMAQEKVAEVKEEVKEAKAEEPKLQNIKPPFNYKAKWKFEGKDDNGFYHFTNTKTGKTHKTKTGKALNNRFQHLPKLPETFEASDARSAALQYFVEGGTVRTEDLEIARKRGSGKLQKEELTSYLWALDNTSLPLDIIAEGIAERNGLDSREVEKEMRDLVSMGKQQIAAEIKELHKKGDNAGMPSWMIRENEEAEARYEEERKAFNEIQDAYDNLTEEDLIALSIEAEQLAADMDEAEADIYLNELKQNENETGQINESENRADETVSEKEVGRKGSEESDLDDKIASKKAELKARKANRGNLGISGDENENNAYIMKLYTDLAGLYIAKGVKTAIDFAKELGEDISDLIQEAWDKANAEPVEEELDVRDTFENREAIENNLKDLGDGVYYHGSPDITYLNSKEDLNTAANTKNAESKYLNVSPKASVAVSYSIHRQKIGEKSGVAAFKLKGKGYTMKNADIKELKSNEDYEAFYDEKKSEGYDYVKVPQDANDIVVLNNNAIEYVGKKLNIEALKQSVTQEVAEPEEQPEEKEKALLNRAYKGATREELQEAIEKHGLTYEVESWEKAKKKARALIDDIGIEAAIDAVRQRVVVGAPAAFVWGEAIDRIHNAITVAETTEEIERLTKLEADLMSEFDTQAREQGRFISALQEVYSSSDFQYDLETQISEYKRKNGGEIPKEVEDKMRELSEQLKEVQAKFEEAKKRADDLEYAENVRNIQDSVAREKGVTMTQAEIDAAIEKGVESELNKAMARLSDTRKKTAKKAIEALEKLDKSLTGMNFDATIGIPVAIVRGGIKTTIAGIKLTGKIADAIESGMKYIQEEYEKQFGKKLPISEYGRVKNMIKDNLKDAGLEVSNRKDKPIKEKGGKIIIPPALIRELVESGITDPNELTQAVLQEVQKSLPEATERQVRDAISNYGRTVNQSQEDIDIEIRKIKRAQRVISALEDIANKKRPLRSGLQRDKLDAEERALQKQLKEALKLLPPDTELEAKQLKTTLDVIEKRLLNQIEDLQREIDTSSRAIKERKEIPYTERIKDLIAQRDAKKAEHEEIFGKTELTDEQRLERAIKAIDRAAANIEERIRKGELTVTPRPNITSVEKEMAKKRLADARADLKELQELAGIPEQKRLEQAKNNAKRRINELQNKIDTGDFARKKQKKIFKDDELKTLLAEKNRIQEKFNKLQYEAELRNRSKSQKIIDAILEVWGITRALRATAEFSFMLIQGGFYAVSHPLTSIKALSVAFSHLLSTGRSERFAEYIKTQDWYEGAKEDKLAITEVDYKLSAREELFLNGWVNHIWDVIGLPLKLVSEKAFQRWKLASFPKAFERSNVGAMNLVRITRYLKGVEMLEAQGKTRETHPQDYKNVADMVNTFTGRASLGGLQNNQATSKLLTTIFFSPKMWASTIKTFTPYAFFHFGKMSSAEFENTGNLGKDKKVGKRQVSVAQKMAMADYMKYVGLTTAAVMAIALKYNNDDDEETSVELDPRSSDFLKIKVGNTRIDPWGGRIQMIVLQARLIAESLNRAGVTKDLPSYKRTSSGELVRLGEGYTDTMGGLLTTMTKNKLAPSAALVNQWLFAKLDKEGNTVDKFGNPYEPSEELINSLYPIYIETIKELYEDQPFTVATFLTFYAFLGGGAQTYEPPKPKENKSGVVKPISPIKPIKPVKPL